MDKKDKDQKWDEKMGQKMNQNGPERTKTDLND